MEIRLKLITYVMWEGGMMCPIMGCLMEQKGECYSAGIIRRIWLTIFKHKRQK